MKKYTAIYLTILLGLLFSCSKENPQKSKTEILTNSTWVHEYKMLDANDNLKPDDEIGESLDLQLKFNLDGTMEYTLNGSTQNINWNFEFDETVIKIIGLEYDTIISVYDEFLFQVYQLDESNLIFQGKPANNPEKLTFDIYGK